MKPLKLRACNQCDWIHFAVTRAYAIKEVLDFNQFYDGLTKKEQKNYGGRRSSIHTYERCFRCGNSYTNFRDGSEADEDRSFGHTIQPIIGNES